MIGQLTGMIFFGWNVPFWYTAAWTVGFPTLVMGMQFAASAFGLSLTQFLAGAISGLTGGLISITTAAGAIASSLAVWATITSIALVAGLVIFTGFVIYSGFWVPLMQEANAPPQSSHFSIQTEAACLPNSSTCTLCSSFDLTEDVFNKLNYLTHEFNLEGTFLSVDLADPGTISKTSRSSTPLDYIDLDPLAIDNTQYTMYIPTYNDPATGQELHAVNGFTIPPWITTYLSTPGGKINLFDLMLQKPSAFIPFLERLQKLAQDSENNTDYYLPELDANNKILKKQIDLLTNIPEDLKSAAENDDLTKIKKKLTDIQAQLKPEVIKTKNPLDEPGNTCADDDQRCQKHFQAMRGIYNSWSSPFDQLLYYVDSLLTVLQNLKPSAPDYQKQLTAFKENLANKQASAQTLIDNLSQQLNIQTSLYNALDKILFECPYAVKPYLTGSPCDQLEQDSYFLATVNLYNFSSLTLEEKERLWKLLENNFPDFFKNGEFYFIPKGTNYKVCFDAQYQGPPDTPQTVCSKISYNPNYFQSAAWAKHCATFTPQ